VIELQEVTEGFFLDDGTSVLEKLQDSFTCLKLVETEKTSFSAIRTNSRHRPGTEPGEAALTEVR